MRQLYRITIHGRTLESADLRKLLSRAVTEKRNMDRVRRYASTQHPDRLARIVPLLAAEAR